MKISRKLQEKRIAKGLTQVEVARRLDCTQAAINQYEAGKRLPGLETLVKLAEIYDCTVNDFIYDDKEVDHGEICKDVEAYV